MRSSSLPAKIVKLLPFTEELPRRPHFGPRGRHASVRRKIGSRSRTVDPMAKLLLRLPTSRKVEVVSGFSKGADVGMRACG